jgi:hypothetical protein
VTLCVVRVRVRFWSSVLERVRELKLSGKTCGLLEHVAQVVRVCNVNLEMSEHNEKL